MRHFVLEVPRGGPPPPDADALAKMLGDRPMLVSGVVHGGVGTVCGASLGALTGALLMPAHIAALTVVGAGILGTVGAIHGRHLGERVREQIGLPDSAPGRIEAVGAVAHDVITTSTGSVLLDAAIGGAVGYALSPTIAWVLAGALLASLGGIAGLLILAGAHIAIPFI